MKRCQLIDSNQFFPGFGCGSANLNHSNEVSGSLSFRDEESACVGNRTPSAAEARAKREPPYLFWHGVHLHAVLMGQVRIYTAVMLCASDRFAHIFSWSLSRSRDDSNLSCSDCVEKKKPFKFSHVLQSSEASRRFEKRWSDCTDEGPVWCNLFKETVVFLKVITKRWPSIKPLNQSKTEEKKELIMLGFFFTN